MITTGEDKALKAKIYGQYITPESYEVRDYLARFVVDYDWIEVSNDEDSISIFNKPLNEVSFPVVDSPKGTRLFNPSRKQIARLLGWTLSPSKKEYDVIILGAGPAGLSAAVY